MDNTIPAWVSGTLTPVDKIEVHLRGLRHKAVSVFLLRGDKLLIQRRALGKYHTPGLWANTCCTHPHWNESAAECAERRLAEELGISGLVLRPRGQVEYRADVGNGMIEHELVDLFVGTAPEGMIIEPDPAEVMDFAWVDLQTLSRQTQEDPERFTPWLRIYLRDHVEQILSE